MTTVGNFGTLTIKNNANESVTQNCILNEGVNVIGSGVNANVRLRDTTVEKLCIVEVKENGLVTIAALQVFPQTKVNETALLKNKIKVLNNGDVIKIGTTEITYNNNNPRTCTQAEIFKQTKHKIFPFTTPRRRSCNVGSSAKKAPSSLCWNTNIKESLFSPSPLVVKKNLPPKHNDDWPSEPLDQDLFPFVGHFSPKKSERPLQEVPDTMSASEGIFKPLSPVNVVAPTVRISTCTSTSDFEKRKNDESMIPDVTNIPLVATPEIASNEVPLKSCSKPKVRLSTRLSARKGSLPSQSTNSPILRRPSRSYSCMTPTKVAFPLKPRLTMSEHKLSNESEPSFLASGDLEMENSTFSSEYENSEMNSSTPTSASRTSNTLTLMGTPTSIIKKRNSQLHKSLSFDKIEKTDLDNSEAREMSKSRLFDQSLESVDGDSLALSTDTSSFVYKTALAIQPSANDLEVEESMEGAELGFAPINKSLNSSSVARNDSDMSGITSLASTPEPRNTTSNVKIVDVTETTSNQADLSFESAVSVHDDTTLKDSKIEQVPNYSSITISSNEGDLDSSDVDSENFDCTTEDEQIFLKSEDEVEDSVLILSESNSNRAQVQNIEEEEEFATELLIPENAELQSPAIENFEETNTLSLSARKSRTSQENVEEDTQSSTNIGDGSSLILAIEQEDEITNDSVVNDKTANETFTLSQTPVKMTRGSESLQEENIAEIEQSAVLIQNYEEIHRSAETSEEETTDANEDTEEDVVAEETVTGRKSKRISLKQGTPVASGGSSARKCRIPEIPRIQLNDQTIEINDSEDTDTSTSDNRSKRNFKFDRTPVKNSPNTSAVRSTRRSKISQAPLTNSETTEFHDSEDADATSDNKANGSSKLFRTPVKSSPATSEVRSTRKTKIILPPLTPLKEKEIIEIVDSEDTDNSNVSVSKSTRSSKLLQTPVKNSPTVSRVGSSRKSILPTPSLQDLPECSTSVHVSDEESLESENMVTSIVGIQTTSSFIQGSPIASELQDVTVEDTEGFDASVLNQNKSSLSSKLLQQTPLITFSPATPLTRKSKIPHTPLFQDEENVEPTTDRKSKRISKLNQNSVKIDSPVTSVVGSARKSKVPQTPLLSGGEDMDGTVLTENEDKLITPLIQHSPVATEAGSTRKSKIIHTPSLQNPGIFESQNTSITTPRKSKRISKVLQAQISDSPVPSGVGSPRKCNVFQTSLSDLMPDEEVSEIRKSKAFQESILEEEETFQSDDSEDIDGSVFSENNSRASSLLETPSIQGTPSSADVKSTAESEDASVATTRKSKRISEVLRTSSILDSPVASGVGSARKSKVFQKSLLQEDTASEDMGGLVLPENNSSLLETPSMQRTVAEVKSARKSKVVQTPIQNDAIVETEDTAITPDTKILTSPLILDFPVGSARKSKVIQKSLLQDEAASESCDSEDMDGSVNSENNSRVSRLLETPSKQRTPAAVEARSVNKSKVVQDDAVVETEDTAITPDTEILQSPLISDSPVGSARKSNVIQKSLLQDEAASESCDSEDLDDSVLPENNSRVSRLLETPSKQRTPVVAEVKSGRKSKVVQTPIQGDAVAETENTEITPDTEIVQSPPVVSGVGSARKSNVIQKSLLQDEAASESCDSEDMDGSLFSENNSRVSRLLKTPSKQRTPVVAEVRSARKSKVAQTPIQNDAVVETEDTAITSDLQTSLLQDEDTLVASDRKSKRISKVLQTPKMSDSLVDTVRSTRKSKVLQTPLFEDGKTIESEKSRLQTPSLQDDIEGNTNENTKRTSRAPNTLSLEDTPTASGVVATENETEDSNEVGSRKKPKRISNLLQTPTIQRSPIVTGGRSTRKSKISKTPLLLKNDVETEELDSLNANVEKLNILSTPQNSPAVSGVRSTRKSKLPLTPIITPTVQTRRGSKALQTSMIQEEEANTSTESKRTSDVLQTPSLQDAEKSSIVKLKRTSKLLLTPSNQNSDDTPVTSGIQVKRTSQVLNTPSMQDFNQTNSPLASGIKSKRISKLQQTSLLQEEANVSNASGRKSATPKNTEKSETPISSAIKQKRISKAFQTPSVDFEETKSPDTSPAKSGSTSKVLVFNTPIEQDKSESEVECSPAPKRRKIGKRTAETEPHNDLSDVKGVKTLFKTPKVQKQPRNDLTDVRGVKNILKTPKAVKEPENDLSDIKGVKKLMATPKVQNSPANDLTNVRGVKKLLRTPKEQKEPLNDLTEVKGVKKLLKTPKRQKEPINDLTEVKGVKKLLRTPKERKEPLNDLSDVDGVENLLREQEELDHNLSDVVASPKPHKSANLSGLGEESASTSKKMTPKRGLSEVRVVQKILEIKRSQKVQKSPKNDLTNVVGVKKMFAEEEAEYKKDFNVSGVAEIMNESDVLFDSLLDKKPPKTYGRKVTPTKSASINNSVVSGTPVMSEEVVNWVNTQDFNKGEIVENLTPIKTKNNENVSISKKKDMKIHSSTPLEKRKRGILKEMETNIQNEVELGTNDKYLKKVQFLDNSDLRRSKRTPRTPSKITSEFVLDLPKRAPVSNREKMGKGHKRKVEEDEIEEVSKIVPEAMEEIEPEDAVARKGVAKNTAKKAQSKKPTRSTKRGAQVEEEKDEENVQEVEVEAPKTTRGRPVKTKTNAKTTKTVEKIETEKNDEVRESDGIEENFDQIEEIKAPKITRGRPVKKSNSKSSKKVDKIEKDNNDEVEEHEKIEVPKTTRGRALKTSQEVEKVEIDNIDEVEEVEEKTTRGRAGKTNAKSKKSVEKNESVNNDEVVENEEIPKVKRGRPLKNKKVEKCEEVEEAPKTTRSRAVKKPNIKVIEESLNEEKNESLKTTRSRRGAKKLESDEKQLDSSVIILSDEEKSELTIEVPKKTRGRTASKTNKEVAKETVEIPKTTRQRSAPKGEVSVNSTLENSKAKTEETSVLPRTTRKRGIKRDLEEEKSSTPNNKKTKVENDSQVEVEAEIPKATRGRAVNKNGKKVVVEESEDESKIAPKAGRNRVRAARGNKKSIEDSEMEESKNEETSKPKRVRKTKAEVEPETKTEDEESKNTKTRGTRKLYSLEDSIKIDNVEATPVEVKKRTRTRNVKQTAEIVAPIRSSRRTRK